jgi:hypothetical protein
MAAPAVKAGAVCRNLVEIQDGGANVAIVHAESDGAMTLTVGFINLSAMLLLQLQAATGCDVGATRQDGPRVTL